MNEIFMKMAFNVIGGLGIFLVGMRFMSDGLQNVAGASLRKIIGTLTYNRLFAILVGLVVTTIIQSSSVTTVMVVGFVNSGIMTLKQALGVIMGANIGTTFTGWILVLKVGKYGLPLLGIAAFFFLFSKKERTRNIALTIMGIGMVFFGLSLMKAGFKPIAKMPEFMAWFHTFDATNYFGVLKAATVGCLLTFIVQSSSATLGITIALATSGIITFETGAALVMGENIGTTITALLASLGTTTNARRAAYFHTIFNITGVLWITALFQFYLPIIRWTLDTFMGVQDVNAFKVLEDGTRNYIHVDKGIALVHTIFNVTNMLVFLPFTSWFAGFLEKIVKEKAPKSERKYLTHLNVNLADSPFAATEQSRHEVELMCKQTRDMFNNLQIFMDVPNKRDKLKKEIFECEDNHDHVQKEITEYLTNLLADSANHDSAEEARRQLRLVDEYESVSDYVTAILKLHLRLYENGLDFSDHQKQEIAKLHGQVETFFDGIIALSKALIPDLSTMESHLETGVEVTAQVRALRDTHWKRITEGNLQPLTSTSYMDVITSYRKIKDHLVNGGEAMVGEK